MLALQTYKTEEISSNGSNFAHRAKVLNRLNKYHFPYKLVDLPSCQRLPVWRD